jgi:hypothetical protein
LRGDERGSSGKSGTQIFLYRPAARLRVPLNPCPRRRFYRFVTDHSALL